MIIRPSGRSTDFISPSFGHGCLYNCAYCYMKRHKPTGLTIADNKSVLNILTEINNHAWFDTTKKPNQTHSEYVTYDISCNEDFALHAKHHEWEKIFDFFVEHPKAMGSFATKYVNKNLLDYDPKGKIRIRFSLMPQKWRKILEPDTSTIFDRVKAINNFIEAGYDVHINFSPVIVNNDWLKQYRILFEGIDGFEANVPKGAFYVFPKVNTLFGKKFGKQVINDSNDLCLYLLEEAQVALVSGDAFGSPDCLRISYATSEDILNEAFKRIAEAVKKLS